MVLTTSGGGASWQTITSANTRGPTTGQGTGSATLPTSFCRRDGQVTIHGMQLYNSDAAPQTITIRDRTGATIAGLSFTIPATTRRTIWLSNRPGILLSPRLVTFTASTPLTWTASSKTLTRVGSFTNYTFVAGDKMFLDGGTCVPGWYPIASKTSADAIVLVDDIKATTSAPADITGWLYGPGGMTLNSTSANLTGPFFFDKGPAMAPGAFSLLVNNTSPLHPTDGYLNGTTTLSPIPNIGEGRTGAVLHSYVLTSSPVADRVLTINTISGGVASGGFTLTIPSGSAVGTPFDIGPAVRGRDFYSPEGLFAASIANVDATGILSFSIPGINY